jgi:hypothetical protein
MQGKQKPQSCEEDELDPEERVSWWGSFKRMLPRPPLRRRLRQEAFRSKSPTSPAGKEDYSEEFERERESFASAYSHQPTFSTEDKNSNAGSDKNDSRSNRLVMVCKQKSQHSESQQDCGAQDRKKTRFHSLPHLQLESTSASGQDSDGKAVRPFLREETPDDLAPPFQELAPPSTAPPLRLDRLIRARVHQFRTEHRTGSGPRYLCKETGACPTRKVQQESSSSGREGFMEERVSERGWESFRSRNSMGRSTDNSFIGSTFGSGAEDVTWSGSKDNNLVEEDLLLSDLGEQGRLLPFCDVGEQGRPSDGPRPQPPAVQGSLSVHRRKLRSFRQSERESASTAAASTGRVEPHHFTELDQRESQNSYSRRVFRAMQNGDGLSSGDSAQDWQSFVTDSFSGRSSVVSSNGNSAMSGSVGIGTLQHSAAKDVPFWLQEAAPPSAQQSDFRVGRQLGRITAP